MKTLLLVLAAMLSGCAASLNHGAERVRVVSSESAVAGGRLIDSYSSWVGWARVGEINTRAQNFAHSRGANTALVRREGGGQAPVSFTVEAWLVP